MWKFYGTLKIWPKLDNMGYYENRRGVQISFLDLGSVVKCKKEDALLDMNAQLDKILSHIKHKSNATDTPARRLKGLYE